MRAGDNDGAGGATAGVPRMRASNTTTTFLFFPFFSLSYFRQSQRLGPHAQRRVKRNEENEGGISAVSTHASYQHVLRKKEAAGEVTAATKKESFRDCENM